MYEAVAKLINEQDIYAAIEHVQAARAPKIVADAYKQLITDAYWKYKNLPLIVALAPAGIWYCLIQSESASEPIHIAAHRGAAKALAYNLASFTWRGWNEPGISPTPSDSAVGMQAAKLNLRLARELNRSPDKLRNAHWLLGAHLISAGDFQSADNHFQEAIPKESPATDPNRLLYEGYILLARILMNKSPATPEWDSLLQSLKAQASEDATFSHDQLQTARQVFDPRP